MNTDNNGWKKRGWSPRTRCCCFYVLVAEVGCFFYFRGATTTKPSWRDRRLRHDRPASSIFYVTSCEIGLLALALTPVIITAGNRSLRSARCSGSCANSVRQVFWHDGGLSIPLRGGRLRSMRRALGGRAQRRHSSPCSACPPLIVTARHLLALSADSPRRITTRRGHLHGFPGEFFLFPLARKRWLGFARAGPWLFLLVAVAVWLLVPSHDVRPVVSCDSEFSPEGARLRRTAG